MSDSDAYVPPRSGGTDGALNSSRSLCVVLLNPPRTSGVRTTNAVRRAGDLLGYSDLRIVNLIPMPTVDATGIAGLELGPVALTTGRAAMAEAISTSGALLFGWGMLGSLGPNRRRVNEQIDWLVHQSLTNGHEYAWAVGDARHPSRWHQYTADKHGRTVGGDADVRLRAVLVRRSLSSFRSIE